MPKSISIRKAFVNSTFALSRLQLIKRLAAQPATTGLEAQAGQIINATHGRQPLGDLRSIIVNASDGKQTQTTVIEVEN